MMITQDYLDIVKRMESEENRDKKRHLYESEVRSENEELLKSAREKVDHFYEKYLDAVANEKKNDAQIFQQTLHSWCRVINECLEKDGWK